MLRTYVATNVCAEFLTQTFQALHQIWTRIVCSSGIATSQSVSLEDGLFGSLLTNHMAKKKVTLLSQGQWNSIIDSLVHPATKKRPEFWALDTLLHGFVEQNPEVTLRKFVKYTVPKLLKEAIHEKK